MSNLSNFRFSRSTALATVAVAVLIAGGVVAESSLATSSSARAAAVDLSGLQSPDSNSFAPLIARVKPAVVSVKVRIVNSAAGEGETFQQFDDLPPGLERFFQQFGAPNGLNRGNRRQVIQGEGSGFFVSADGYIVTNNHVVNNARDVTVTLEDGNTLPAKVIGTDPKTDLALLKVNEGGDYPFVTFASQTPRVGDWVVAIGNPYGLGGTATAGIVSAEGRDIGDGPYDQFIQIDAPINRGNSGGPTFDMQGRVVGVNTAIYTPSGGSVGIGFDIPASTASNVISQLEHGGVVERGYLGVEIQPVSADIADSLGLKAAEGALVDKVMPGEPAAAAGLKSGDVVVELDSQPVKDPGDLTRRIGAMKPGETAHIAYLRNGTQLTADITLASQTDEKTASLDQSEVHPEKMLGLQLAPANQVAGSGDQGVAVTEVDPNGKAAEKGIVAGDVILDVAGKTVSTPADVRTAVDAARKDGKKAVLMRVQTARGDRFVAFGLPKSQG